jgi:hypothetical protein
VFARATPPSLAPSAPSKPTRAWGAVSTWGAPIVSPSQSPGASPSHATSIPRGRVEERGGAYVRRLRVGSLRRLRVGSLRFFGSACRVASPRGSQRGAAVHHPAQPHHAAQRERSRVRGRQRFERVARVVVAARLLQANCRTHRPQKLMTFLDCDLGYRRHMRALFCD